MSAKVWAAYVETRHGCQSIGLYGSEAEALASVGDLVDVVVSETDDPGVVRQAVDYAAGRAGAQFWIERVEVPALSLAQAMGSRGGRLSAAKLTPEARSERSRKAASARWAKRPTVLPTRCFVAFTLPDGRIVDIDADVVGSDRFIQFTLSDGEVVRAIRTGTEHQTARGEHVTTLDFDPTLQA